MKRISYYYRWWYISSRVSYHRHDLRLHAHHMRCYSEVVRRVFCKFPENKIDPVSNLQEFHRRSILSQILITQRNNREIAFFRICLINRCHTDGDVRRHRNLCRSICRSRRDRCSRICGSIHSSRSRSRYWCDRRSWKVRRSDPSTSSL